jgi:hypothetical protein
VTADVEMDRTPSGIAIVFRHSNHRYQIAQGKEKLRYVPSVSTVLDKTLPKNLSGWAERNAVAGCLEVLRAEPDQAPEDWTVDEALAYMQQMNLRWWQRREAAATRGTSVHSAFETLSEGKIPKLSDFPVGQRGYLRGLFAWWSEVQPEVEYSEVMLASANYDFAGRTDLIAKVDGRRGIVDLKTSKGIFESHHFQLAGYKHAAHESGYGEMDFTGILRVGDDGTFEFRESWATEKQFLSLLTSYTAQKQFEKETPKEFKPQRKKAA